MNNRRVFLQQLGMAAMATMLSESAIASAISNTGSQVASRKIGLQLFTLRDLLLKDVKAVISEVSKIGYNTVETYYGYPGPYAAEGFWGLDAKAFRALLEAYQMSSPSGHYNVTAYLSPNGNEDVLKSHIETAAIVGQQYFVVPAMPTDIRTSGTIDDYKQMAQKFNRAGELCKDHQLKLGYHNHAFEFKDLGNGVTGYDVLLKETDPGLVSFELDIFWLINAGYDPLALFKENPGRFKMWHVKDMDKTDKSIYTEVGTGRIDYKRILAEAKLSGLENLFVEQDVIKIDPYKSITQSLNYVKTLIR
jgi:sugar phosphate isomerase/epimerase